MQYNGKYSLRTQLLNEGWFSEKIGSLFDKGEEEDLEGAPSEEEVEKLRKIGKKNVETWEELKLILNFLLHQDKITQELERGEHKSTGAGLVIKGIWTLTNAAFPVLAAVTTALGVVKDIKGFIDRSNEISQGTDQKKIESNPYLDALMLDAGYSEVMDNSLEKRMLKDFLSDLNKEELSGPIDPREDSFSDWAEDWIKDNPDIAGNVTLTGAENKGKFTDIVIPDLGQKQTNKILDIIGNMTFNAI